MRNRKIYFLEEIVQIFRNKLDELESDIEEILKMEYGEKMIKSCETQVIYIIFQKKIYI